MHVICVIDDGLQGFMPEAAQATRKYLDDVRFCFLLVGKKRDPLSPDDRDGVLMTTPIECLYELVKSTFGNPQITVNDKVLDINSEWDNLPRPLSVEALVATLRSLHVRLRDGLGDQWFFACDVQIEDEYSVWPLRHATDVAMVDQEAMEFHNKLVNSKEPAVQILANFPEQAFGLFCAWLLKERHKYRHVAAWSNRITASVINSLFTIPLAQKEKKKTEDDIDDLFRTASEHLGIERSWIRLASTSLDTLADRYSKEEPKDGTHNIQHWLTAPEPTVNNFKRSANDILQSLGTDPDVRRARSRFADNTPKRVALAIAKTKAVAYRRRSRVYLFDLLDYVVCRASSHVVFFNGEPVDDISDISVIIHEHYKFRQEYWSETFDVFAGLTTRIKTVHRLTLTDSVLHYHMQMATGDKEPQITLCKLLWGTGDRCLLVKGMRVLFGQSLTVIPATHEPSAKDIDEFRPNGLYMYAWPATESKHEFLLSINGYWRMDAPSEGTRS